MTGLENLAFFEDVGLTSPRLNVAHCVWVNDREQEILASRHVKVTHCPGSNAKLGSGLAPITDLRARGVCVSLGSDGAACNNHLDMFGEMRLAAGLQAMRSGPGRLDARDALWMATREGARALGLDTDLGSIETGKKADLILIASDAPHHAPAPDPFSAIVYTGRPTDVRLTMVDGEVLVAGGVPLQLDVADIARTARLESAALAHRARLA
jgi:cytosine/adenosine deaminase-related metal-dependent hydrolase